MLTPSRPYEERLASGLVLRSIETESDVERLAAFNGAIHGAGVAGMTRQLILHHPHTRPKHWLYVEDPATDEVVSALCLIPWTLRYDGVSLRAGEMGIVGTHQAYRHKGLVRVQAARHAAMLQEDAYDLSHIQGIPYFYRQFGYEYAMPLEGGWRLELDMIPRGAGPGDRFAFRPATEADIPDLVRLHDRAARVLAIASARDKEVWRYLLGPSRRTEMAAETWLVLEASAPVGYLRVPAHGFGEGLIVNEVSPLTGAAAHRVIAQLGTWARARQKPYIRLCLPASTALVATACDLGAHSIGHYAWQVKIVEVPGFLRRIAPVLEKRIAASPFAGLTRTVCVDTYRTAYRLSFEQGKLVEAEEMGFQEGGALRLPPALLAPLLLGYRTVDQLSHCYHDVRAEGTSRHLLDVLFPRLQSFLTTVY